MGPTRTCPQCGGRFTLSERLCPHDGSVLSDAVPSQEQFIGKTLAGKYRIDGLLKRGGMGSVYRATHLMLNKAVAIKLIKPELVTSEDTVRRFQREARAASHLIHPNIVTIHDLGQAEDGTLYIAMELVSGKSVKELVTSEGPLTSDRAVGFAMAIASALALAHKNNIVHRDLKPQNIMIGKDPDGREIPKLLDFGIAKTFETDSPALTSTGMVLGTPHYMSPEQAGGKPVDARSDLYALGVILYEMLAGKVPFDDPSIPAILVKHMNEAPRPPSELRPGLPAAMEQIVLRCLEKEPAKRFQSAEEFSFSLAALASTWTATESPPTVGLSVLSRAPAGSPSPPPVPSRVGMGAEVEPTVRAVRRASQPKLKKKGLALALGSLAAAVLIGGSLLAFLVFSPEQPPPAEGTAPEPSRAETLDIPSPPAEVAPPATSSLPPAPLITPPPPEPSPPASRVKPTAPSPQSEPLAPPAPVETPLPASPSVYSTCQGLADACGSFRSALQEAFDKAGLALTTRAQNAEILLATLAEEVEARTEEQFGTTFVIRTYSIEVTGEAPRFGETLAMPPPEMVSFDTRFGAEKLKERSRVLADTVTETIQSYWSEKRN